MSDNEPTIQEIIDRLHELSDAVTKGRVQVVSEFTMRVPAEPKRDADLVLSKAAMMLKALNVIKNTQILCDCCKRQNGELMTVGHDRVCYQCCYEEAVPKLKNENARINSGITFNNKVIEDYKKENSDLKENSAMLLRDRNHFEDSLNKIGDQAKDLYAQNQNLSKPWISIEKTLPDWEQVVFCCLKSGYDESPKYQFMFRHYENDGWWWCDHDGGEDDYPVTHWMPMPLPPSDYKDQKAEVW